MRKIIAFTILCFFSLLIKNEKAISKSLCQSHCEAATKQPLYDSGVYTGNDNEPKQYDGFFFKI